VYVWIEPSEFLRGSNDADEMANPDEQPQHKVWLDGYWIQRTEVTNGQYKRCVDAGICEGPSDGKWITEQFARQPVVDVDWEQAKSYAEWVGGRLPTGAEWEKACRGTDARSYPWGNDPPTFERANYYRSGLNGPADVGRYPPGANGLYDMAGNVWEWTADWYGETYRKDRVYRNPIGPADGEKRTLRGGSFFYGDLDVRCAYRGKNLPDLRYYSRGFRVAMP